MTKSKSRTRNRRGEGGKLREEIVRAAADLLDEGGNEQAVTLRAVARKIDITPTSIYLHFPDRDSMLLAVVQEAFAALEERVLSAREQAGPDPAAQLKAVCVAYIEFATRWPRRYRVMFGGVWDTAEALKVPSVADDVAVIGDNAFDILLSTVGACSDASGSTSTNPVADATALWVALHGFAQLQSTAPLFPWPPHLLDTLIDRLVLRDGVPS